MLEYLRPSQTCIPEHSKRSFINFAMTIKKNLHSSNIERSCID